MAKKTREELEAERAAEIQNYIELSLRHLPIATLYALAQAEELGLEYFVTPVGDINAIDVTIVARKGDLDYEDDESVRLYQIPSAHGYTMPHCVDRLFELNARVIKHREELKRREAVKKAALDKLTDEEKKVLGLR